MLGDSQKGLHNRKYGQLCQSLLDLELAADNIFNAVTYRVDLEHQRLESVKGRIQKVQNQIKSIMGTSRAVTVFSSSKYPTIPASEQDFVPLFGGRVGKSYSEFPLSTLFLSSGLSQNGGVGTLELYKFFAETSCESWLSMPKQKGIGSLPTNMDSIVDAFLFNTTEMPYSKYQIVDNLLDAEIFPLQGQSSECSILPPPPQSILDCSNKNKSSEDLGFRPVPGQVPSFTLPPVLPDLPNVAEINWSGNEFFSSIAPSALPKYSASNPLPIFSKDEAHSLRDSQNGALLASIRNTNITLQKTGEIEEKNAGIFSIEGNKVRQPGKLLSEMATALKLRHLSMLGASQSNDQVGTTVCGRNFFFSSKSETAMKYEKDTSNLNFCNDV